ncbi:hypothetical protein ACP70R_030994 [Stipagrostis hirtigluma subsp. patula]
MAENGEGGGSDHGAVRRLCAHALGAAATTLNPREIQLSVQMRMLMVYCCVFGRHLLAELSFDEDSGNRFAREGVWACRRRLLTEIMREIRAVDPVFETVTDAEDRIKILMKLDLSSLAGQSAGSIIKIIDSGYWSNAMHADDFTMREAASHLQEVLGVQIIDGSSRREMALRRLCEKKLATVERLLSGVNFFLTTWQYIQVEIEELCNAWNLQGSKKKRRQSICLSSDRAIAHVVGEISSISVEYRKMLDSARQQLDEALEYRQRYLFASISSLAKSEKRWKAKADISGLYMLEALLSTMEGAKYEVEPTDGAYGEFMVRVSITVPGAKNFGFAERLHYEGSGITSEKEAIDDAARKAVLFLEEHLGVAVWDVNFGNRIRSETETWYLDRLESRIGEISDEAQGNCISMISKLRSVHENRASELSGCDDFAARVDAVFLRISSALESGLVFISKDTRM